MYTGPQISHILGITIDYPMDICSSPKIFNEAKPPSRRPRTTEVPTEVGGLGGRTKMVVFG